MDSLPTASSLEIFDISYNDLGNDSLCNLKTWTSKWSNISIGVRCITNGCSIDISTYHNCPGIIVTIVQAVIGAFGGVVSVAIVTMKMIKVFQNSSRKEETNYNDVENSYKYVQELRDVMSLNDDDEKFQIKLITNNIPPLDHRMYYCSIHL
ncbi:unnamed protein product [Mytilus coruscus]|uniref:Uncharacterized protein n=1 Tax=Mytilus coruscus TaxID=42192 RepID=A0A6J8BF74_MYTCO|nr:unnamed protein product [Mytilus coruscus]